ncbi:MAG: hypothetical protein ACMUIL_12905, partial [bacterium]
MKRWGWSLIRCVLGLVLIMVLPRFAQARKKTLRIAYPVEPKTADCQKTTEHYTLPLNVFDRLVEAVTVSP